MELHEILQTAATAYDVDGFPDDGDSLATFVQQEVCSVHDPQATLAENAQNVWNAMETAINQLIRVQVAFGNIQ